MSAKLENGAEKEIISILLHRSASCTYISSNRVHLVSKLLKIPGIPDNECSRLFDMIYSRDIELFNLAEKIITKKETDYEKTKCSKIENEK